METLTIKSAKFVSVHNAFSGLISAELEQIPVGPGDIFALVKVGGRNEQSQIAITELIKQSLTEFNQSISPDTNIPRRFEQIVQTINDGISELVKNGLRLNTNDLHAVIGIVNSNQVFITGVGQLHALFLHRTAKQRYVIYELDKQFQENENQNPDKPFITILDGELHPGDIFYVATRIPAREIDLPQLQDILVTLPPIGALKRIEQHLGPETAYGGISFRVIENIDEGPPMKTNPLVSIEQFGKTQDETAILLGEQHPDVVGWVGKITGPILKHLSTPGTHGTKSLVRRILRFIVKSLSAVAVGVSVAIAAVWRLIKSFFQELKNLYNKKIANKNLKEKIVSKVKGLSLRTKIAITAGLASLLILFFGLSAWQNQIKKTELTQKFEQTARNVEEKREAAEASLIYNNTTQARTLLSEAQALLSSMSADSDQHREEINRLQNEINANLFALRGATSVEPKILGNLETSEAGSQWQDAFIFDGSIYAITNQANLWNYSELNSILNKIELTKGTSGNPVHATAVKAGFLFLDGAKHLGRTNLTTKTMNPVVSGVEKLLSAEDLAVYNDNLYVLTSQAQQIIKMRPQGDGFEAGTAWITARNSDITKATAMAVDGDIYLIVGNNVVKFSSGHEGALTLAPVDPALTKPTGIWTSFESKYPYLLEPEQNRVIVYDKQGKLIAQYLSDGFRAGRELLVREDKKEITVITDTQILSFTANHLLE